ncbi:metallophosphoesterase [Sorangium sp. So ce269]
MAHFNWLHLSDLHYGMSDQLSHWPNVREILYRDLATIHEHSGPWHLLLFTGDLTQQGSRGEFGRLDALLDDLLNHLRKLGSEPVLLAVPGNHDLVRPRSIAPAVKALKRWAEEDDIRADFWRGEDSDYRKVVAEAFAPFAEFWRRRSERLPVAVTHGILPGDFSTTIEREGVRLGVVGLNSSFLQLTGESYEKKLDLDIHQIHAACGGDTTKWLEDKSEVLLLTHHPVGWLHDERRFTRDIAPPGRFTAHLFGHMHEHQSELSSRGGSPFQCRLQGASLFGLEKLSNGGEERIYGYSAGRLEIHEEVTALRYWPRRAMRKSLGHYRLHADPAMELSDDGSMELRLKESAPAKRGGATRAAAPKAFDELLGSYRRRLQPIYERWPRELVSSITAARREMTSCSVQLRPRRAMTRWMAASSTAIKTRRRKRRRAGGIVARSCPNASGDDELEAASTLRRSARPRVVTGVGGRWIAARHQGVSGGSFGRRREPERRSCRSWASRSR